MCHDVEKRVDDGTPGPTGTIYGNCSGRTALMKEQLDNKHSEG
jgi:hypothetical protein